MLEPVDSMQNTRHAWPDTLSDLRRNCFNKVVPLLNARLEGRPLNEFESKAAAFVVDRRVREGKTNEEAALQTIFGLGEQDDGRETRKKLMDAVHAESIAYIAELLAKTNGPAKKEQLDGLKTFMNSAYQTSLQVYEKGGDFEIGAVPKDWVPAWL